MLRDSVARPRPVIPVPSPQRAVAPDVRELRRALGTFATGVTIVTARAVTGAPVGLTVNSFASVSLDPPLVLWSLRHASALLPYFATAAAFAVHVLRADQAALARRFAAPIPDRFDGVRWHPDERGLAVLPESLARFECTVVAGHDAGDHRILLGSVDRHDVGQGEPLVFAGGTFRTLAGEP